MIDQTNLLKIWKAGENPANAVLSAYYSGKQTIAELNRRRIDGRVKSQTKTNWTKMVVDMHTGFLMTRNVNYTLLDPAFPSPALDGFLALYKARNLSSVDTAHLAHSILYGFSPEIVSFDGKKIQFTRTHPAAWVFVRDENEKILAGIYKAELPKFSVYEGELLTAPKTLYFVYDAATVTRYEQTKTGVIATDQKQHYFGQIPIVLFSVSPDASPFLTDPFFQACDQYDITRNALTDEIRLNVDALLVLESEQSEFQSLFEKDKNGVSGFDKAKAVGLLPISPGNKASYLARNINVNKFQFDLRVSRHAIHMMGRIPDLTDTVNANGASSSISGIALKLLFQAMIQQAGTFAKHFENGLNKRIELINRINEFSRKPQLTGYDIALTKNVPQSDTELLQYLANMREVLSVGDIQKLLPFVENPTQALYNWTLEKGIENSIQ